MAESLRVFDPVADIIAYHDRTKHHPDRYARGPHGLDWASQPNPFRRFANAPVVRLPLADSAETSPAGVLFGVDHVSPRPLTLQTVGAFFELSMGLSARKEIPGSSWYLRMNPSSGNLHPTEAYAILPALDGLSERLGVYHYAPLEHALEHRARWLHDGGEDRSLFFVGLSSITWREAWKYGERAFRYCQHDAGHALAALRFAAATLGWRLYLCSEWTDTALAQLLGLDRVKDFQDAEPEIPEMFARVVINESASQDHILPALADREWFGIASALSDSHVEWPAIDEAVAVTRKTRVSKIVSYLSPSRAQSRPPACNQSAGMLIRQRRSAVDFDGVTSISRATFLQILDTTLPRSDTPPFDAWPFAPRVHLIMFVHRVTGLAPGLYVWLRAREDMDQLRAALRSDFAWEVLPGLDPAVPLFQLGKVDLRAFAQSISCHQGIAADGAFSLGMLVRFAPVLREFGAPAYRELFWETGMIGQALYLAAEAAGVRATGIGCYLDDEMHRALGLHNHDWQSLYHFTVGGPVDDPRLRTLPPYAHLKK